MLVWAAWCLDLFKSSHGERGTQRLLSSSGFLLQKWVKPNREFPLGRYAAQTFVCKSRQTNRKVHKQTHAFLTQVIVCGWNWIRWQIWGACVHAMSHLVITGFSILTEVAWWRCFWDKDTNTHSYWHVWHVGGPWSLTKHCSCTEGKITDWDEEWEQPKSTCI